MSKKWFLELVQDFDGSYYANLSINGKLVQGLPEYVDYKTLSTAIREKTGIQILKKKDMLFQQDGRKKYAYIDNTQERPDCRVALAEVMAGWRPRFDPEFGPIPEGPIYIPPQASHTCNLDDPCILVGTIIDYKCELEGEYCASAPSFSVRISGRIHGDGDFESAHCTANFYDTERLYETSLDAAKVRVTELNKQIQSIKDLPKKGTPAGPYGKDYFAVLDISALSDGQLVTAKELAKQFVGPQSEAVSNINSEMLHRFSVRAAEQELANTFVLCMAATKDEYINSQPSETYELNSVEECIKECARRRNEVKEAGYPDYFAAYVVAEDGSNPWNEIFVDLKAKEECLWLPLNDEKCISVWFSPDKQYGDELSMKLELRAPDGTMGPHCEILIDERYSTGNLSRESIFNTLAEIYGDAGMRSVRAEECDALTDRIMSAFKIKRPSLLQQIQSASGRAAASCVSHNEKGIDFDPGR